MRCAVSLLMRLLYQLVGLCASARCGTEFERPCGRWPSRLLSPCLPLAAPGGSNHSSRKFLWRSGIKCPHHRAASRPVHFLADRAPKEYRVSESPSLGNVSLASGPVTLKHYQILSSLGDGGFGEVYEAWDNKLLRSVAIKRLKNAQGAHSVLREAQLAASLQHAAFVKIYALEDDDASPSIVMELVRGQTLKQLLADARPTARQALAMVRQVAGAMREAHESGLVHGDLKPSNLMVEPSGTVRILDFGLATQDDAQATTSLQNATRRARSPIWRRNACWAGRCVRKATSTRSAWCSTSC